MFDIDFLGEEIRQNGAVAVHTYSDNRQAVNIAIKALATVPLYAEGLLLGCGKELFHSLETLRSMASSSASYVT